MADGPAVLVVGAASRDLDPADPRGWRLGGAVTYASLAIARLGLIVRTLIGVDSDASSAHELQLLRAAGCELELVRLAHGPVFDNQQTAAGRRQIAHDASDRIVIGELPRRWRTSQTVLLGPVAGELGPEWANCFGATALLGLTWQGLLRRLEPGRPVERLPLQATPLIARADISAVSAEDLVPDGAALADLLPHDGQQLLISNGSRRALYLRRDGVGFHARTFAPPGVDTVRDTTGAGDVLLGVWLAALAAGRAAGKQVTADQALHLAMTAATAKVEAGPLGAMPDLRAICDRLLKQPFRPV